jgi:hypothetical protein
MNKVNSNNIQRLNKIPQNKIKFNINPLDINLAKIQHNLLSRCGLEVPENGDFAPVTETFKSLDPTIDLSEIKVICKYNKLDSDIKNTCRILCANISRIDKTEQYLELFKGTKKELLEYLNKKDFFAVIKNNAIN